MMNKRIAFMVVVAVCVVCSTARALYEVYDTGTWPKSWPAELEPLRKQAHTLVGPLAPDRHYAIPFTKREEFEAAWPHILKVKRKGATLFLKRGRNFFLGWGNMAGVVVHCPPLRAADHPDRREAPIPGATDDRADERDGTSLELVVDGETVDLNRIPLPPHTTIIDERFR